MVDLQNTIVTPCYTCYLISNRERKRGFQLLQLIFLAISDYCVVPRSHWRLLSLFIENFAIISMMCVRVVHVCCGLVKQIFINFQGDVLRLFSHHQCYLKFFLCFFSLFRMPIASVWIISLESRNMDISPKPSQVLQFIQFLIFLKKNELTKTVSITPLFCQPPGRSRSWSNSIVEV